MLKMICQSTSLPCVAIGGINVNNAKIVLDAGAIGIAVISAVVSQKDIIGAAKALRELIP